jgi:hypothetical protein
MTVAPYSHVYLIGQCIAVRSWFYDNTLLVRFVVQTSPRVSDRHKVVHKAQHPNAQHMLKTFLHPGCEVMVSGMLHNRLSHKDPVQERYTETFIAACMCCAFGQLID